MDHLKRGLIVLPLCWALTTALPADEMSVLDRSVGTTIELAAGDQSVAMTIGLAVRAVFQAAPLAAQNGNGNGNDYCKYCEETMVLCEVVREQTNPTEYFTSQLYYYCYQNPEEVVDIHIFHLEEECGASFTGGEGECRACGWTSDCHDKWDLGLCHEECAGGGDPDLLASIQDELGTGDLSRVTTLLQSSPAWTLNQGESVIEVVRCDGPPFRIPVHAELTTRLVATLRQTQATE